MINVMFTESGGEGRLQAGRFEDGSVVADAVERFTDGDGVPDGFKVNLIRQGSIVMGATLNSNLLDGDTVSLFPTKHESGVA